MATTSAAKCTKIDAEEWKNTKNTDGIPPLGSSIHNCGCSACKAVMKDTVQWTSMQKEDSDIIIKIGDRVLVHGCLPGVVRYVGDLDSGYTNDQIYIGVKLDDPVGNNDGTFNNKCYFTCPENHGLIVPIEKVHILVPSDGRSIPVYPVTNCSRFYSMPEMSDVDSSTSGLFEIPRGVLQRGFSDGYLSSCQATPAVSPKMSLDDVRGLEKESKGGCMNRSAVFICQEPGSIAAGVEVPDSVKPLIQLIRDPDKTTGGNSATNEEAVDSDRHAGKTLEENDDANENEKSITSTKLEHTKSIQGNSIIIDSVKKIEHKQNVPVEVFSKTSSTKVFPNLLSCRKVLISNSVPNAASSQHNKVQITTSRSASGSVNLNIKKINISKLATTSTTAVLEDSATTKEDKEMEPKDIELEDTDISPPEVPRLALVPVADEGDKELASSLVPYPSYTCQLLSSLPIEEDMTPLTASTQLNEVVQFGDWMDMWGGGMKGWVMAQTLQKLKDAQRKGAKEVLWQKSINELETDEEFSSRILHIKTIREEIGMVQKMQAKIEQELREKKIALSTSQLCQEIEAIQEETKAVQKMNKELSKMLSGSIFSASMEVLERFGYLGLA